jgi:hypothetical protein
LPPIRGVSPPRAWLSTYLGRRDLVLAISAGMKTIRMFIADESGATAGGRKKCGVILLISEIIPDT